MFLLLIWDFKFRTEYDRHRERKADEPAPSACMCVQSCPTLCDPTDCSLPGSSVHGIFLGKNMGVGYPLCRSPVNISRHLFFPFGTEPQVIVFRFSHLSFCSLTCFLSCLQIPGAYLFIFPRSMTSF